MHKNKYSTPEHGIIPRYPLCYFLGNKLVCYGISERIKGSYFNLTKNLHQNQEDQNVGNFYFQ